MDLLNPLNKLTRDFHSGTCLQWSMFKEPFTAIAHSIF